MSQTHIVGRSGGREEECATTTDTAVRTIKLEGVDGRHLDRPALPTRMAIPTCLAPRSRSATMPRDDMRPNGTMSQTHIIGRICGHQEECSMATDTAVQTINIDGIEYELRPPTDDSYADLDAWLEHDLVVEYADEDQPDDAESIRTYGIECVPGIVDAEGRTVGFVCPDCQVPVLLHHADVYQDRYRGCPQFGCDVVVYCGDVLPKG